MLNYRENRPFLDKVRNFPTEVYRLDDENTRIYQLMYALLEIGVGTAKTLQEVGATLQRSLANTRLYDLDDMYGSIFRIYRLTDEIYTYNPYADPLTKGQWLEVDSKDAAYRHRISLLLSAFQHGGSPEGIAMVAEAASGVKCDVFEAWRDDVSGLAITDSTREFIIVPRAAKTTSAPSDEREITEEQEASIIYLVNLFKPVNTICNVIENDSVAEVAVTIPYATAVSEATVTRIIVDTEEQVPHYIYHEYEDEFCINDEISLVSIVEQHSDYIYSLGTLISNITNSATTMNVTELNAPTSPVFYCKVDDEIVLVTDRVKLGNTANQYTYTITRGLANTNAASHLSNANIFVDFVSIVPESPTTQIIWSPWTEVGLADSPDNYPNGKYPSRSDRYDSQGRYIFEFISQDEYLIWLERQIRLAEGEIRYSSSDPTIIQYYRVPLYTLETNPLLVNNNDLLAQCTPEVTTRVLI